MQQYNLIKQEDIGMYINNYLRSVKLNCFMYHNMYVSSMENKYE